MARGGDDFFDVGSDLKDFGGNLMVENLGVGFVLRKEVRIRSVFLMSRKNSRTHPFLRIHVQILNPPVFEEARQPNSVVGNMWLLPNYHNLNVLLLILQQLLATLDSQQVLHRAQMEVDVEPRT